MQNVFAVVEHQQPSETIFANLFRDAVRRGQSRLWGDCKRGGGRLGHCGRIAERVPARSPKHRRERTIERDVPPTAKARRVLSDPAETPRARSPAGFP